MNKGTVYALWDYEAQNNDELSFHEGDAITILRRKDENETEWWWARLGDREGYVPKNLLGVSTQHTQIGYWKSSGLDPYKSHKDTHSMGFSSADIKVEQNTFLQAPTACFVYGQVLELCGFVTYWRARGGLKTIRITSVRSAHAELWQALATHVVLPNLECSRAGCGSTH